MHPLRILRWEDIVLDVGEIEVPGNAGMSGMSDCELICGNGAKKSKAKMAP